MDIKLFERVCRALGIDFDHILACKGSLVPYSKGDVLEMVKEKLRKTVFQFSTDWYSDFVANPKWRARITKEKHSTHHTAYADTELEALLLACDKAFCKENEMETDEHLECMTCGHTFHEKDKITPRSESSPGCPSCGSDDYLELEEEPKKKGMKTNKHGEPICHKIPEDDIAELERCAKVCKDFGNPVGTGYEGCPEKSFYIQIPFCLQQKMLKEINRLEEQIRVLTQIVDKVEAAFKLDGERFLSYEQVAGKMDELLKLKRETYKAFEECGDPILPHDTIPHKIKNLYQKLKGFKALLARLKKESRVDYFYAPSEENEELQFCTACTYYEENECSEKCNRCQYLALSNSNFKRKKRKGL